MVNYILKKTFTERSFMNRNDLIIRGLKRTTVVLVVICLIGAIILNSLIKPNGDGNADTPAGNDSPQSDASNVILPQGADAGDGYIDKLYFVGDSTTLHFKKGGIDPSHIFVPESGTLMLSTDILDVKVTSSKVTIPQAVKNADAEILIITVGVNGADSFTKVKYSTYYKKLINAIKEASPDTKIILQSVFPVEKYYSEKDNGISNEGINLLNEWAKEIAADCSVRYLDTQSILKNENGAMIEDFSEGDGVHMNASAYKKIIDYIKTHPIT